jgi:hypothetical protein
MTNTHNERLRKVLQKTREAKLKIKVGKCRFLYTEIQYLGFVINKEEIRPDPHKVDDIVNMPQPRTLTQLRSFMGMVNFYKKFIPKLAFIAKPLYDLIKTAQPAPPWGEAQTTAFDLIKTLISKATTLANFNKGLEIEIHCDACDYGVAGTFLQVKYTEAKNSGKKRRIEIPLQYASKTLSSTEEHSRKGSSCSNFLLTCISTLHSPTEIRGKNRPSGTDLPKTS